MNNSPVTAIVGANWGDEGKGKVTDCLAARADIVVRFQGGGNAGHTIINEYGKFALHLLPSGVFYPEVINVLGPGVAVEIPALLKERQSLMERGVPEPRLMFSERAQVVLPFHPLLDGAEEDRRAGRQFGSTRKGIAPFYGDKYLKLGVQICELAHPERLTERLEQSLAAKNVLLKHLYGLPELEVEPLIEELMRQGEAIQPFVGDTTALLHEAVAAGKSVLVEGQLGALRDPDHGIYPFPTSSSPLAGFASVGAGLPPHTMGRVIAVAKAYSSCVGAGPFVVELDGTEAEELRRRGNEYGATTGRPRRVGWFDAVATRYGCRVQGATEVALSLLDVLGYREEIPVCVGYEIDEEVTETFLVSPLLDRARPVYETLPGWGCDVRAARSFGELPAEARAYVNRIEELVEVPIKWISVGPEREALIER
jgi:adenylosuccinate synthase